MTLRQKQSKFTVLVAGLILAAIKRGYELTFGDVYRDPRLHGELGVKLGYGHRNSCHKLRLAVDFNLFKDGKLLEGKEADKAHAELHLVWTELGGSPAVPGDSNHYSIEHEGTR